MQVDRLSHKVEKEILRGHGDSAVATAQPGNFGWADSEPESFCGICEILLRKKSPERLCLEHPDLPV